MAKRQVVLPSFDMDSLYKVENVWKGGNIILHVATGDRGRGMEHRVLKKKESMLLNGKQLSEQIRGLALDRPRRKAALKISLVELKEEKQAEPEGYVCPQCGEEKRTQRALDRHMKKHEESVEAAPSDPVEE